MRTRQNKKLEPGSDEIRTGKLQKATQVINRTIGNGVVIGSRQFCDWRQDNLRRRRNAGPRRMLPLRRRNLCEELDSHHRGRSGVTPAWSRSVPARYQLILVIAREPHEQAQAYLFSQFVGFERQSAGQGPAQATQAIQRTVRQHRPEVRKFDLGHHKGSRCFEVASCGLCYRPPLSGRCGISKTKLVSSGVEKAFSVPPCASAICDAM
jgi:hypothetical protein